MEYEKQVNERRKGSWYQGVYKPIHPEKCINKKQIDYKSSWEAKVCYVCDISNTILKWGYEILRIPYSDIKGKKRTYISDFNVVIKAGDKIVKCIWEVKPQKQGPIFENGKWNTNNKPNPPKRKTRKALARYNYELKQYSNNMRKWEAMRMYCKANGYVFKIISEKDIQALMNRLGESL